MCPSVRFSIARIFMIFTPVSLYERTTLGVKIKNFTKIFRGSFGAAKFLTRMLSLILRSAFQDPHRYVAAPFPEVTVTSLYFRPKVSNPERLFGVKISKIQAIENLTVGHL
jgi:hypothetical protein